MPCAPRSRPLLQIGAWAPALTLMRWLRALGVADFGVFPQVGAALCELTGRELAPVYRAMYPQGYRSPSGVYAKVGALFFASNIIFLSPGLLVQASTGALQPAGV